MRNDCVQGAETTTASSRMSAGGKELLLLFQGRPTEDEASWTRFAGTLAPLYEVLLFGGAARSTTKSHLKPQVEHLLPSEDWCQGKFHLVGSRSGARAALRLAASNPARILSLTLIEPTLIVPLDLPERATADVFATLTSLAANRNSSVPIDPLGSFSADAGAWTSLPYGFRQLVQVVAESFSREPQTDHARRGKACRFRELARRTLLVCGESSPEAMRRLTAACHEALPGSGYAVVAAAEASSPVLWTAVMQHLHESFERRLR